MKTDDKANSIATYTKPADSPEIQSEAQPVIHQESAACETTSVNLSSFSAMFTDEIDIILLQDQWFFQPMSEESPENFTALKQYLNLGPARTLEQLSTKTNELASVSFVLCKKFNWEKRAKAFDSYILDRKKSILASFSLNAEYNRRFREEKLREQQWLIHQRLQQIALQRLELLASELKPAECLKFLEMSDKLGRAACATGSETPPTDAAPYDDIQPEWEELLEKAYGHRVPATRSGTPPTDPVPHGDIRPEWEQSLEKAYGHRTP